MVKRAKANTFSVRLGTGNTFTGGTTVNASGGMLEAAEANALGGTSGVIINSGGTLLLSGAGDRVNDAAGITLAGGTFSTGGLSETVGALTLTANSYIDFGAGSSHLRFADSQEVSWGSFRLSIYNWSGNTHTSGGADQLRFPNNGLTPDQLTQIDFFSDAGVTKLSIRRPSTRMASWEVSARSRQCPSLPNSSRRWAFSVWRVGEAGASWLLFARGDTSPECRFAPAARRQSRRLFP